MSGEQQTSNVLFLCTGNSARSVMGESIVNQLGKGKFRGYSAGSNPKGTVHPLALAILKSFRHPTEGLRSKSWEEFAKPDAPKMDFIFTLCDRAAQDRCPVWPGHPMTVSWSIPDPTAVNGSDTVLAAAFADAYGLLLIRIQVFLALPFASLDRPSLQNRVHDIGQQ
jgi:arsenate reductase (thioredoxin)